MLGKFGNASFCAKTYIQISSISRCYFFIPLNWCFQTSFRSSCRSNRVPGSFDVSIIIRDAYDRSMISSTIWSVFFKTGPCNSATLSSDTTSLNHRPIFKTDNKSKQFLPNKILFLCLTGEESLFWVDIMSIKTQQFASLPHLVPISNIIRYFGN